MAEWYRAAQQFTADLEDGSQQTVALGEVLPAGHELVKRDLAAAAEGRDPLFKILPSGEPDEEAAPKPRASRHARRGD